MQFAIAVGDFPMPVAERDDLVALIDDLDRIRPEISPDRGG